LSDFLNLAREAAKAALEKKAQDVVIMRMTNVTIITDYFVIATSTNKTHSKAIADNVEERMEKTGINILSREGLKEGKWILLDYGCIIVHIFQEDVRRFYDLESLWGDAEAVDISNLG
jgi:ribosome-associated protein